MGHKSGGGVVATNKKAFRDFVLRDKWECGIELKGAEVKSIRAGNVNFKDSFARVEDDQAYLHNLYIDPYKQAALFSEEPDRVRKLLLHKREIKKIVTATTAKGLNLVPTKIYFNKRGLVKIEIAAGKGKKFFDKRELVKKRTLERGLDRVLKHRKK